MCPSEFESGFMLRQPSWHKKENAVLANNPACWDDARKAAGLLWDIYTVPVSRNSDALEMFPGGPVLPASVVSSNYQAIIRNDKPFADPEAELAIQKKSYQIITNEEFGQVIDTALGLNEDFLVNDRGEEPQDQEDDPIEFEALMSLYGGKQIIALIKFLNPLKMDWDPSKTYRYMAFVSRHDGQGGLRGLATNVRIQCANTHSWAEATDGKYTGFTIKHTANWEDRLAEVARNIASARTESAKWLEFAEKLSQWQVGINEREAYLKRLLPVSDDMTERKADNVLAARDAIRNIQRGPTCEHIGWTGYGLLMATTEWNDHHREYQSVDTYVSRQLLHKETLKAKSARILQQMAKA